jgi:hypothetical protein
LHASTTNQKVSSLLSYTISDYLISKQSCTCYLLFISVIVCFDMQELGLLHFADPHPGADMEGQSGKLAMQEHVLQGSLALSQEQLASVSMIEDAMQSAVTKLSAAEMRHLMLHMASQLAEVWGCHSSSQLKVGSLQSNLQAADQLNDQLKQRIWQLGEQLNTAQEERARSVAALLRSNQVAQSQQAAPVATGAHIHFQFSAICDLFLRRP